MNISVEELEGDRATLRVDGRLDLVSAGGLRRAVEDLLAAGRRRLVVDLADVPFMDSSGVGALVGSLKLARNGGGELRIAAAGTQVREVLRLTTIDRVLHPYDSVDAALETL
jgi:anti-sigma B factor antagonist